jgi:hypothetical protein
MKSSSMKENPDKLVKYESRLWWKENKFDTEYKESWNYPRLPKSPKEEKTITIQKQNRRGRCRVTLFFLV